MAKSWIDEGWRFAMGFLVAVVAGVTTGLTSVLLIAYLIIYGLWMIYRLSELENWLRDGGSKKSAPDVVGTASEIMQLIYREKKYSDKQKDRLRASLTRFNDMAAELPDATIVLNDSKQIIWANSAAATLMNIQRKRDAGQRIDNLIREPAFHDYLQKGGDGSEIEMHPPNNPKLTLALRLVSSGDACILTGRDVTQRVLVRDMRKAFVANVSHELRTPLTVIKGYLEILVEDKTLSDDTLKALHSVNEQSDRMSHIVEDLLTLSRLESSNLETHEGEEVDMQSLVNSVLSELALPRNQSKPVLQAEVDTSLLLFAKQTEVHSAVQNLVQNAWKYAHSGGVIKVTWSAHPEGAALVVADKGAGIGPAHLPRLSERFYRVDTGRSRESGGTGLGLAIVKYIVQRHGGRLNIRSSLGVGSEFELVFPAERIVKRQSRRVAE